MKDIHLGSIYHLPWLEYRHALPDGRVCLRLRTGAGEFDTVTVRVTSNYAYPEFFQHADNYDMERAYHDELFDYFEVILMPKDPRMRYLFVLKAEGLVYKLDASGIRTGAHAEEDVSQSFAFAYAYPPKEMPKWARGCVGYQIFPDRFSREGDFEDGLEPWESDRVQNEFRYGGNIRGMIKAVPYLKELGVEMVYTTPMFVSDSSHRYNTFDYFKIDPLLGTEEDLRDLCDELHKNDMKLVLDGVFNHSGTAFAPFVDAKEKGKESAYYDWFHFDDFEPWGYRTFGHWEYMPKLNLENPDCADYFLRVGQYWMETCQIDGWRLDVSPEVCPNFWRQYQAMMIKVNPESIMIAECWDDSREWCTQGDMFDATMHYVLSRNLWDCFAHHRLDAKGFDNVINRTLTMYPQRTHEVLWTFLGSHDTQRMRTRAGGDVRMLHAASFFQFTFLGTPIIYYGDELGMEGGEDPFCRFPMKWHDVEGNPTHAHYQKLTKIRQNNPVLREGSYRTYAVKENGLYAYLRELDGVQLLCVLNTSTHPISTHLSLPKAMAEMAVATDLYKGGNVAVENGEIYVQLNVGEGMILQ